jgi:hypothetical protein
MKSRTSWLSPSSPKTAVPLTSISPVKESVRIAPGPVPPATYSLDVEDPDRIGRPQNFGAHGEKVLTRPPSQSGS